MPTPSIPKIIESTTDKLLTTPFQLSISPERRVRRLEEVGVETSEVLRLYQGHTNTDFAIRALRCATAHSCLPSLRVIAKEDDHGQAIARDVASSFQGLAQTILDTNFNPCLSQVKGQLSETAIIAVLWWGISEMDEYKNFYVTPATKKQDRQGDIGIRSGFDLTLRRSDKKKIQPIEVKSSRGPYNAKEIAEKESLGVSVVTPSDTAESLPIGESASIKLLEMIAKDDTKLLPGAYRNLRIRFKRF